MKKKFGVRMLHGLAAMVLTAGLLTNGVLALDCKHPEIAKGYCKDCDTQYVALVGDAYYKTIEDAVKAAEKIEDKAVLLLSDLKDQTLELGEVYLAVGTEAISIADSTLKGEKSEWVLLNEGKLSLQNVTITNDEGSYALLNKGGTTELDRVTLTADTAQVRVEGGLLELMTAPVDDVLVLESQLPGIFAAADEAVKEDALESWIKNNSGAPAYDAEKASWEMSGDITSAVKLEDKELVYSGEKQLPTVKVILHGRELIEGEDYTVSCPALEVAADEEEEPPKTVDPVGVKRYTLHVEGKGIYTGAYDTQFAIDAAEPVIKWSAATDSVTYTGSAAVLNVQAVVETVDGSTEIGSISYTYRAAGTDGTFQSGLPVNAGAYEVKAAVAPFGNHAAAETAEAMVLTVQPKTVTPAVVVSDGEVFRYTGSAHTPAVTVKDGETVIPASEYTVSYDKNTDVGTAAVTVTDVDGGNYVLSEWKGSFDIAKAAQSALTISGAPASVTYGDASFQLGVSGGSTDAAVVWEITEGSSYATVDQNGTVEIIGVGKVTVQAKKDGNANYESAAAQCSFEIKPAVLTIESIKAADKIFDGTKTVKITEVVLKGVKDGDDVRVNMDGLSGEIADAKAGTYTEVKLGDVKLSGAAAKNYTITQPAGAVKAPVKVLKADLTTALESIEVKLLVGEESVVADNLGGAMPKNAGALTYTNRTQSTGKGTQAIVLNWGVDTNGKLTAQIVNSKGGDQIIFEVAVASENYNTAVVKVIASVGAKTVDSSKLTVTLANKELVYNGKAQTPALTVQYDGATLTKDTDYEVKAPTDATTVGEKELTIAFKGSYEGSATAKYTITKAKVTVSGTKVADKTYNGNTTAAITVGTVSGVVQGDDVKVTATGVFADKNSGSRTVTVTYKLEGRAAGNYVLATETEGIKGNITAVTAAQLNAGISGITTANVTENNRYALQNAINQANTALGDTGLSTAAKTNITNVKLNAESMISRIETAAGAASTDSIRATKDITGENVEMEDRAALEKAKSDLNSALNSYSGNYTAAQKKNIQDQQTRVDNALTVITRVQSAERLIDALPDDLTSVDAATRDSIQDAQDSYDKLTDYEKSLIGEDTVLKLDAAVQANGAAKPENTPDQSITDEDSEVQDKDTVDLPMGIFWGAVLVAALIAVGFLWMKIKQRNKPNW